MKKGWMLSSFVLLFIISNNVKAQTDGKIVVNLAQKGAVVSSFICVVFFGEINCAEEKS